jgi:MtrB/PioB family decaheme-associated outer membrane protein
MRLKLFVCLVVIALLPLSAAFSEDKNLSGEVSVTGVLPYIDGNKAKFNEYRDYRDGVISPFGGVFLDYDNKKGYFFDFGASDIGYDTQRYSLEGGKYGSYKYSLLYDEIPHNQTWNARSFYADPGGSTLNYTPATGNRPTSNADNWVAFDYQTKRKALSGGAEFTVMKPFFFSFNVGRETKDGTGVSGISSSSSNGAEIPMPVSYTTDHMKAEIGYGKQPFFAAFNYYYQKFSNDDRYLDVRSPFPTVTNSTQIPLAPANDYQKFSFLGNVKLPFNSKFNAKADYAHATSNKDLVTSYWSSTLNQLTNSSPTFDGEVNTQNYNMVLTSVPFSFLTGKAFYRYYKKDNSSDQITVTPTTGSPFQNSLFDYHTENYGAELDFRVIKNLHFIAGYAHNNIDRTRDDIPKNKDDFYKMEARYNLTSVATLKGAYEYLVRAADYQAGTTAASQYTRMFDAAAKNQTTWKVDLQLYPVENLNFNIMYKYVKVDYKDTTIGITDTEQNFWGVNGDYTFTKWLKAFGYFDWDELQRNQFQRRGSSDPFGTTQNTTNYNWTADQVQKNYDWGLGTEIAVIPKTLTIRAGYDNVRSSGTVDLNYLLAAAIPAGQSNDSVDLPNVDSYRKECFFIRGIYNATPSLTITGGYAYESYRYNDAGFNGYQYTIPAGSASPNGYLTGLYADPSYKANIVFLGAAYKF